MIGEINAIHVIMITDLNVEIEEIHMKNTKRIILGGKEAVLGREIPETTKNKTVTQMIIVF